MGVGGHQLGPAALEHVHLLHRRRVQLGEQAQGRCALEHHAFGHAVVQQRGHGLQLFRRQGRLAEQAGFERDAVFGDALDPLDGQAAVVGNVGGLGRPG
jgi:hypothetical protein